MTGVFDWACFGCWFCWWSL